jgi:hypothetical protein
MDNRIERMAMTQQASYALKEIVDHAHSMGFTPSYYLLRDLYRIVAEKPEGDVYGVSFGAETFCHIHDRVGELAMYQRYYRDTYPNSQFYFWDEEVWEQMECMPFFSKLFYVFYK